jgi:hypothetical protein
MLSSKLIQLIEDHWDPITTCILEEIRHNPRLRHVGGLPESDLRERARDILERLGHWLSSSREDEMARRFEAVGALRFSESIPLAEVVLAYLIVKERMLDFVRGQGMAQSTVALYAEEELEHCVGQFFDSMTYYVIRGYERAMAETPQPAHAHAGW